jgi:L-rhamnose-H+ transport protein
MEQLLGILLHTIGGLSSASFYVPSHKIKKWAWETYWITLGFVAWVIMPTVGGLLTTPDIFGILRNSPWSSMGWAYFFGVLWGFGGLMCGLSLRFAGLSLGQSISLGVCAIVGTLVPAALDHKVYVLVSTIPGWVVIAGFAVCLLGIASCGYAGLRKEKTLTDAEKKEGVKDFALVKGLTLAVFGGIMSASMALAIKAGEGMSMEAIHYGTARVFMNIPIFVMALAGGFTTNFISSMILTTKNKSFGDYIIRPRTTLAFNYFLAAISGLMWYGQYFFYGMGTTKMGKFDFASWSIHMAAIIIFSNLWGLWLNEWKHVDRRTRGCLWFGIVLLTVSVVMIGVGNNLAGRD